MHILDSLKECYPCLPLLSSKYIHIWIHSSSAESEWPSAPQKYVIAQKWMVQIPLTSYIKCTDHYMYINAHLPSIPYDHYFLASFRTFLQATFMERWGEQKKSTWKAKGFIRTLNPAQTIALTWSSQSACCNDYLKIILPMQCQLKLIIERFKKIMVLWIRFCLEYFYFCKCKSKNLRNINYFQQLIEHAHLCDCTATN